MSKYTNTNTTSTTTETYNNDFTKQHIFISGSLAVGKSTIMNLLNNYLQEREDVFFIREYIDFSNDGERQLEKLHTGIISNYQFQLFVIRCYEKQLNTIDFEEADVIVWERHPIEALEIFCRGKNMLSDKERLDLMLKLESLCNRYKIPQLKENNINYISVDTSAFKPEQISFFLISEIIYEMLLGQYENDVFILLFCSDTTEQLKRLIGRRRPIEVKKYKTVNDLLLINNIYFEFFLERKDHQLI
ncbi:hypothetical protein KM1_203500 [Entamoeba histolytica HM-3:IMSS]|uniref:Deoxynucleoside kinase domain-containing protein n=2 Tax=Entamoeba histolytica TaxID=5759 RepID=M2S023_ENTHI|nr:Hypothetical protein EHI5A_151020 [Entamoeba histolytica KU27]EMS16160.1 hypothetical protein KM1_203500 [Entamoeba histolytica HM-3:IMSS]